MARQRRQAAKATDISVHIGVGGTALVIRFITLRNGEFTIAVPLDGARTLAQVLLAKANEAGALARDSGSERRH